MAISHVVFSELPDSRTEYYAHWMSMTSLFSGEEYYGFDLYDKRLFDILLPGSHHSGMYASAIQTTLKPSKDSYFSAISYLNDTNKYIKWSTRQHNDIYNQLISGCRFLDIRLEKSGSEYYAHHGMLGASLPVMISHIKQYMNEMNGEIIIIKISDLIEITTADLDTIFLQIMRDLGEYMADSKSKRYDISKDNIGILIKRYGVRIVLFMDKTSVITDETVNEDENKKEISAAERYDSYFFDANEYLVGDDELHIQAKGKKGKNGQVEVQETDVIIEETQALSNEVIISNVLLQLAKGWDGETKMNQIYWDVNIEYQLQINKYTDIYDSFVAVHSRFIPTLRNTVATYGKLYFVNIIIVDFAESLSIDAIIILMMNYASCYDLKWGPSNSDCPKLTKLSKSYKTDDISPTCQINDDLQVICARSCGLCDKRISNGLPNAACSSSSDCNGTIYKLTRELYGDDASQICHFNLMDDATTQESTGFCLSPFARPSCGVVDFLMPAADTPHFYTQDCNSPCIEDYECLSGYCWSRNGICLTLPTPDPTPYPTPRQGYFNRIRSEAALRLTQSIKPLRAASTCQDLTHCADESVYISSLIAFGIIPIIFGSILLGIYCFTCFTFCAWSQWSKFTFCRCFDGLNAKHWWFKWIFAALLFIVLAIISWQCAKGLQSNTAMHQHLFDTNQTVSFKGEILEILDTTTARFKNVGDDTKWIAATMALVLEEISDAIKRTNFDIDVNMEPIYKLLEFIINTYSDIELKATIIDPQTMQPVEVVLTCSFCENIGEYILVINNSLSDAVASMKEIELTIEQYSTLVADKVDIGASLLKFSDASTNFTQYMDLYREGAAFVIDIFEILDTQRQYVGTGIFVAPLFWISLFCIALGGFALIMYVINKRKYLWLSEYVFRITWCCMMFVGCSMLMVFGVLAMVNIGWADFCVFLDNFEADPMTNSPKSFHDGAKVINACWSGANLFETFNLNQIQDWADYEKNISFSLRVDIFEALNIAKLDLFSSEIGLLDIDEFQTDGDVYLSYLNQIGPPCTCNCLPWGFDETAFSRQKFQNGQCFTDTSCWTDISSFLDMTISQISQLLPPEFAHLNELIPSDVNDLSGLPLINDMSGLPLINDLLALQVSGDINLTQINKMISQHVVPISNLDLSQVNVGGFTTEQLIELMIVNSNIASDYDPTECMQYVALSYGKVMAEYILFNETMSLINNLKDEVYNLSQSYDGIFVIGIGIENVLANITHLIAPLLERFDLMIDDYARCGFIGEIYGGFKEVCCVYVFQDMTGITKAMLIISILSVFAVFLALCTQYLFHPVRKLIIYRSVYADDIDEDGEEIISCPQCGNRFPLSQGINHAAHAYHSEINQNIEFGDNKQEDMDMEMGSIVFGAAQLNEEWNEYKSMINMAFYTFAGYVPWAKYDIDALYIGVQELRRFLDIICINEAVEELFDINDERITYSQFINYFTNICIEIKQHIQKQVTWKLLCKSLQIFAEMDDNHSDTLQYSEFQRFGEKIGLNDKEIELLFNAMDPHVNIYNNGCAEIAIDIKQLFEWFSLILYEQRGRIKTNNTPTIQFDFKTAEIINIDNNQVSQHDNDKVDLP